MALDVSGLAKLDSPILVRGAGSSLSSALDAVDDRASDLKSTWAPIGASYDAPEVHQVLTAMDTPAVEASSLAGKGETVETALDTYADRLEELQSRKTTLIGDIESFEDKKAEVQSENADNHIGEDIMDFLRDEDIDLMHEEEDLSNRAAQLQADKDAAERDCANAIGAIWGAPTYEAAGETAVWDETVYGTTAEGYEQLVKSGDAPWGHPSMWSEGDWTTKVDQVFDGAVDSVAGTFNFLGDLVGVGGAGQAEAAWSGLGQLGMDLGRVGGGGLLGGFFSYQIDPEGYQESANRLLETGKGIIGWDSWDTSGWQTGGGLGFDVALGLATGGGAFAAKAGIKAALKGAKAGSRIPGSTTASTLSATLRNGFKDGLDGSIRGLNDWIEQSKKDLRTLVPQLLPADGSPGGGRHQFDVTMPDRDGGTTRREGDVAPGGDSAPAGPSRSWDDPSDRQRWVDDWLDDPDNRRPERSTAPWADYQRNVAGPDNILLRTGDGRTRIAADGLTVDPDTVVALEAKFVSNPGGRALYEGDLAPKLQDKLMAQFDGEMERYRQVMDDSSTPVDRLRIVTNTPEAADYLTQRARGILGADADLQVVVRRDGS